MFGISWPVQFFLVYYHPAPRLRKSSRTLSQHYRRGQLVHTTIYLVFSLSSSVSSGQHLATRSDFLGSWYPIKLSPSITPSSRTDLVHITIIWLLRVPFFFPPFPSLLWIGTHPAWHLDASSNNPVRPFLASITAVSSTLRLRLSWIWPRTHSTIFVTTTRQLDASPASPPRRHDIRTFYIRTFLIRNSTSAHPTSAHPTSTILHQHILHPRIPHPQSHILRPHILHPHILRLHILHLHNLRPRLRQHPPPSTGRNPRSTDSLGFAAALQAL